MPHVTSSLKIDLLLMHEVWTLPNILFICFISDRYNCKFMLVSSFKWAFLKTNTRVCLFWAAWIFTCGPHQAKGIHLQNAQTVRYPCIAYFHDQFSSNSWFMTRILMLWYPKTITLLMIRFFFPYKKFISCPF